MRTLFDDAVTLASLNRSSGIRLADTSRRSGGADFERVYRSRATLSLARLAQLGVVEAAPHLTPLRVRGAAIREGDEQPLARATSDESSACAKFLARTTRASGRTRMHRASMPPEPPRGSRCERRAGQISPRHRSAPAPLRFIARSSGAILHCTIERGRTFLAFGSDARWMR